MASSSANENGTSEFLYHVKRSITEYAQDKSGATQIIDILGTFTILAAAKAAARGALASEGYVKDDFELYEENNGSEDWQFGDGVIAYAKAPAGQEFHVRIDTKPNSDHFSGNS